MATRARIPLFLNPASGTTAVEADELARSIDGVEVRTVGPGALAEHIAREVAAGTPVIAIAGGDGTIHSAAPALVGTRTALLCVPTGTLNYFARRIGIEDVAGAAEALRMQRIETVPLGVVQDGFFLNTLTFGEYARVVRMRERFRSVLGKWPAALLAFGVTLATMRRVVVTLSISDEVRSRRTPFVWVGIGWGSFPLVHESPERRRHPELEVAVVRSSTKRAGLAFVVRVAADMLRGQTPVRDPELEVLHTRQLTLDSRHRIDATTDGEVLRLLPPVQVGVRDDALRVLVGPRFEQPVDT